MKKSVLTQNKGCCLEPSCHAELVSASCCCNKAVMGTVLHDNKYGFTMVEILVAVLIIAVLVIVAVPQYQKSILKSRFNSLMPTTKTIRDSQESYYLQHSRYATQMSDLDVKAAQTGGMDISFGEGTNADFKYVLASRPALHNNLIMYQKQSPKFAGHTHCEALKSDGNANWLCSTALHGQSIEGSISGSDYNTYILEGAQGENDYFGVDCDVNMLDDKKDCDSGCGKMSRPSSCNDHTGSWEYGEYQNTCVPKPTDKQDCTNGVGKETRTVTCNAQSGMWETGTWSTSTCYTNLDPYYYNTYQTAYAQAQQLAAQMEAYHDSKGYYPSKSWTDYSWGTCYYPDNVSAIAGTSIYCTVNAPSTRKSQGAVGIVLNHTTQGHAGESFCRGYNSQMSQVCGAVSGEEEIDTPHYY